MAIEVIAVGVSFHARHPLRLAAPFARLTGDRLSTAPSSTTAAPAPDAFGASRQVTVRVALPGGPVRFPLRVLGDPARLSYQWVSARDGEPIDSAHLVAGADLRAPAEPGFYRLAVHDGAKIQIIDEPTLAVLVPFQEKVNGLLNGYRIGTYLSEKLGGRQPTGFLEVDADQTGMQVSRHFRVGDFITHDAQADVWPKYVALDPRLLDKLELVIAKLGGRVGTLSDLELDVHSGFRTPAHNAGVRRAARDSRHQYGDAADVAIDANGDGQVTLTDEIMVQRAVDAVEQEHPDLVGGLGLYVSRRYRSPYVHIDARGKRSRWRG